MRAFVTGGTGFLGGRLVRLLRARGDEVLALVRSRERGTELTAIGCALAEGDLSDPSTLAEQIGGCDSVFHLAGIYKIGISARERREMHEVNVGGTENVLDAALEAGVTRIVYVSTVNAFGNTGRRVVDETFERPQGPYLSAYDETKHRAHEAAVRRIRAGAPIVIVQPGLVYGPGDHSEAGGQLTRAAAGKLRYLVFPELGVNAAHVDDIATGILLVHDRGRSGEAYVLGGEVTTMRELVRQAAGAGGHRPPRLTLPTALMKPLRPLGPLVGRAMSAPPNLREVISAADGVTYWATDAKARRELGYAPRGLADGMRAAFGPSGDARGSRASRPAA